MHMCSPLQLHGMSCWSEILPKDFSYRTSFDGSGATAAFTSWRRAGNGVRALGLSQHNSFLIRTGLACTQPLSNSIFGQSTLDESASKMGSRPVTFGY